MVYIGVPSLFMDIAKSFMIFQFEGMIIVLQSYQGFNSNNSNNNCDSNGNNSNCASSSNNAENTYTIIIKPLSSKRK